MTKVFVTVGTTPFHSLVCFFDVRAAACEIVIQHAEQQWSPVLCCGFPFTSAIEEWYRWADVVVTHAGAGTIYALLEQGRRMVVVPNVERSDKHQLDLANHVAICGYAPVVRDLSSWASVEDLIKYALEFEAVPYVRTRFFMAEFLLELLGEGEKGTCAGQFRYRQRSQSRTSEGRSPACGRRGR
jgi:beta-1,4-N-acetylglucosaminyltransferase